MKKGVIVTLILGMMIGAAALATFDGVMHATSTDQFCGSSCHEMSIPRESWQQSAHYRNAHGVSVACADCHIPQEFVPKMVRKIEASREVWGHWTGLIDTPEKYAAHQPAMRERELSRMRANDSQECRNCHEVEQMDFAVQDRAARRYHRAMASRDKTCIDCHADVAHGAGVALAHE
jgi:cytochrome c-type protein NapC